MIAKLIIIAVCTAVYLVVVFLSNWIFGIEVGGVMVMFIACLFLASGCIHCLRVWEDVARINAEAEKRMRPQIHRIDPCLCGHELREHASLIAGRCRHEGCSCMAFQVRVFGVRNTEGD